MIRRRDDMRIETTKVHVKEQFYVQVEILWTFMLLCAT